MSFYLLFLFLQVSHWIKGVWGTSDQSLWADRMGRLETIPAQPTLWVHAASVGEVNAAMLLINPMRAAYVDHQIVVTTQTRSGLHRIRSVYGSTLVTGLAPFDIPHVVKRFLDAVSPKLLIIMETELWPNIIRQCAQRSIPIVLANARLSPTSVRRYRWIAPWVRGMTTHLSCVLAQSDWDKQHYAELGVSDERLQLAGNLKYACHLDPKLREQAKNFRQQWGDRPTWIAASTHEGEEAMVLQAFGILKQRWPNALLIMVPRHLNRVDQIQALCQDYTVLLRSQYTGQGSVPDVFLVDTMGECVLFYGCADVAFVGGSLVPVGGHNPIEPLVWGLPILVGPHTQHFAAVVQDSLAVGLLHVVDPQHLAETVLQCLEAADRRKAIAQKAKDLIDSQQQALHQHLACINSLLE